MSIERTYIPNIFDGIGSKPVKSGVIDKERTAAHNAEILDEILAKIAANNSRRAFAMSNRTYHKSTNLKPINQQSGVIDTKTCKMASEATQITQVVLSAGPLENFFLGIGNLLDNAAIKIEKGIKWFFGKTRS